LQRGWGNGGLSKRLLWRNRPRRLPGGTAGAALTLLSGAGRRLRLDLLLYGGRLHLTLLWRGWRWLHFAPLWRRWLHLALLRRRRWWLHLTLLLRRARRLPLTLLWRRRRLAWTLWLFLFLVILRLFPLLVITLRCLRYHEHAIERRRVR
jgi:hypothetical protein